MLFDDECFKKIEESWEKLEKSRAGQSNAFPEDLIDIIEQFETSYKNALNDKANSPVSWNRVCEKAGELREAILECCEDEMDLPVYYNYLTSFTDKINSALKVSAKQAKNLDPDEERENLLDRIEILEENVQQERDNTNILQQEIRKQLDEVTHELEKAKRPMLEIEKFVLVDLDGSTYVTLLKEALEALKQGIDILYDQRFTIALRTAAKRTWQSTKKFTKAVRERFEAFKLPWSGNKVTEHFEGNEPDFGLPNSISLKPGIVFREANFAPEMVVVPAGRFIMGSKDSHYEQPQHEVTISEAFAIGKYPVTFGEYDHYCEATNTEKPYDRGWERDRRPVINVSWHDAQSYIKWLNSAIGVEGSPYGLLSEAQWEYACRAGSNTKYCFGDDESQLADYTWYDQNLKRKTHPVGEKKPNDFGLYDMHGNVWEWCEDDWHEDYKGAPDDGSAWLNDNAGKNVIRVLRGGSWINRPGSLRSANRYRDNSTDRNYNTGFRITRTLH